MEDRIKAFFDEHHISRNTPIPLHFQLRNMIKEGIKANTLLPGDCLPTEYEFVKHYNISRTTVRQALSFLVNEGTLYRLKSKGTFIAQHKADLHYITTIESFESQIRQSGMVPRTEVLELKVEECNSEVSSYLEMNEGDKVIFLKRRRFIDGIPAVITESYLPYDICEHVLSFDLAELSLLFVLGKRSESTVVEVSRTLEAISANTHIANLLEVRKGFPLQFFISISQNKNDRIIEYCRSYYRGDKNKFTFRIRQ